MVMKADIKARWVEALRSGEYEQDTNCRLKTDKGFCCLGVLEEIAAAEGIVTVRTDVDSFGTEYVYVDKEETDPFLFDQEDGKSHDTSTAALTRATLQWSGLENPLPFSDKEGKALSHLNDNGVPFVTLAEIIESDPSI